MEGFHFPNASDFIGIDDSKPDYFGNGKWPWIIFSSSICFFGIVGNIFSISLILILKEWKSSVFNVYILQLAIADTILLITFPFSVQDVVDKWIFSKAVCQIHQSVLVFNYFASVMFLTVISFDRFIAVCFATSSNANSLREPRIVHAIVVAIWLTSCLAAAPIFLKANLDENNNCVLSLAVDMKGYNVINNSQMSLTITDEGNVVQDYYSSYGVSNNSQLYYQHVERILDELINPNGSQQVPTECIYPKEVGGWDTILYLVFGLLYVLPVTGMVITYGLIIRCLRKNDKRLRRTVSQDGVMKQSEKSSIATRRVITTSCILVIAFALCWAPLQIFHLTKIIGIPVPLDQGYRCELFFQIARLFAYLNSALNPYIYSFLATSFQNRCRKSVTTIRSTISTFRSDIMLKMYH